MDDIVKIYGLNATLLVLYLLSMILINEKPETAKLNEPKKKAMDWEWIDVTWS